MAAPVTTARSLIILAMKESGLLGVGQTPLAEDINDAYIYLSRMMKQWQIRRGLIPALKSYSAIATGNKSMTVGPGGEFNITPRPRQIKKAYFIQLNTGSTPVSLPLTWVASFEDYFRITVKDLHSLPDLFFYDNQFVNNLSNIYFWPIPDSQYQMFICVQSDLSFPNDAVGLDDVLLLPDEYEEAIHYNLAIRICSGWTLPARKETVLLAKTSLKTIRSVNAQIPEMQMPTALRKGKAFSIFNADGF